MRLLQASRMSRALKALSDVNRIRILEILVKGEFCVSDLVERLGIDQPKVSHHLAILRGAGVIRSRRQGRHINYSIRPSVLRQSSPPGLPGGEDSFHLGDLVVSFRFGGTGGAGATTRTPATAAPLAAPAAAEAPPPVLRELEAEHS